MSSETESWAPHAPAHEFVAQRLVCWSSSGLGSSIAKQSGAFMALAFSLA